MAVGCDRRTQVRAVPQTDHGRGRVCVPSPLTSPHRSTRVHGPVRTIVDTESAHYPCFARLTRATCASESSVRLGPPLRLRPSSLGAPFPLSSNEPLKGSLLHRHLCVVERGRGGGSLFGRYVGPPHRRPLRGPNDVRCPALLVTVLSHTFSPTGPRLTPTGQRCPGPWLVSRSTHPPPAGPRPTRPLPVPRPSSLSFGEKDEASRDETRDSRPLVAKDLPHRVPERICQDVPDRTGPTKEGFILLCLSVESRWGWMVHRVRSTSQVFTKSFSPLLQERTETFVVVETRTLLQVTGHRSRVHPRSDVSTRHVATLARSS